MDCPKCAKPLRHKGSNYCSMCGYRLNKPKPPRSEPFKPDVQDIRINPQPTDSKHTIEFILTLIGFIIGIFGIFWALMNFNDYFNFDLSFALLSSIIGVVGAIIIRYYPRIGAIFSLVAGFLLLLTGAPLSLIALLFYVISAILCYARN